MRTYKSMTDSVITYLTENQYCSTLIRANERCFQKFEVYLNQNAPKERHSKRRLTHGNRLAEYTLAIKDGGFIRFKTDNDKLFDFTISQIEERKEELGLEVRALTRDLHSSPYKEGSPMTEYEEKFSSRGKNINFVELIKIGGR